MANIKMYGHKYCVDCKIAQDFFKKNNIDYDYIDVEKNSEKLEEMYNINGGKQIVPTILSSNGKILLEPSNEELEREFFHKGGE